MSHAIHPEGADAAADAPGPPFMTRLLAAPRALLHELAGIWRYAAARREFDRLDADALRDIGMSRAEFDSYWAEAHGLVEPTRTRVVRQLHARSRP
jgi:uncharacterized protein YjiS (DUF1127 family)